MYVSFHLYRVDRRDKQQEPTDEDPLMTLLVRGRRRMATARIHSIYCSFALIKCTTRTCNDHHDTGREETRVGRIPMLRGQDSNRLTII